MNKELAVTILRYVNNIFYSITQFKYTIYVSWERIISRQLFVFKNLLMSLFGFKQYEKLLLITIKSE